VVGVEQWAEIRRMHRVERLSVREIHLAARACIDTIARALAGDASPKYVRRPGGSKLDPFNEWICEQVRADARIQSRGFAGDGRRAGL
jgi:hypothetical protein